MTEETELPDPFDDGVVEQTAVDTGIEAIRKIHAIERTMLNRAIYSLADITGKTVEEVLAILAEGINSDYDAAVQQAEASAKIVTSSDKAEIILPVKRKPTWEK